MNPLNTNLVQLSTLNLFRSETACANVHSLCSAVYFNSNLMYVSIPDSIALSMGMAYVVTEMNALAAYFTLSHFDTSL